jgi:hypothetical protein
LWIALDCSTTNKENHTTRMMTFSIYRQALAAFAAALPDGTIFLTLE